MQQSSEDIYLHFGDHWWLRSRHDLIVRLLTSTYPDRNARLLDVGCAAGALMRKLEDRGFPVTGIEISGTYSDRWVDTHLDAVLADAEAIPLEDARFDVVIASDVIEHVQDEMQALAEFKRVLSPGGRLLIFAPAFEWLWSSADERAGHYRRYTRNRLRERLSTAGFSPTWSTYWNVSTFPLAVPLKLIDRATSLDFEQFDRTNPLLNEVLFRLLRTENSLIERGVDIPVGVSVFSMARVEP